MLIKDRCADTEPAESLITLAVSGAQQKGEEQKRENECGQRRDDKKEISKHSRQERGKGIKNSSALSSFIFT